MHAGRPLGQEELVAARVARTLEDGIGAERLQMLTRMKAFFAWARAMQAATRERPHVTQTRVQSV